MKLHFAKRFEMTDETAGYVSAAVNEYCQRFITIDGSVVNPAFCQVFDIGSGKVYPGVKATKSRLRDIEDTCRNIADIWLNL